MCVCAHVSLYGKQDFNEDFCSTRKLTGVSHLPWCWVQSWQVYPSCLLHSNLTHFIVHCTWRQTGPQHQQPEMHDTCIRVSVIVHVCVICVTFLHIFPIHARLCPLQQFVSDQTMKQSGRKGSPWRMRADDSMEEAARSRQSVQLGQGGHQATQRRCTPCPDSGERLNATLSLSEDQANVTGDHWRCIFFKC